MWGDGAARVPPRQVLIINKEASLWSNIWTHPPTKLELKGSSHVSLKNHLHSHSNWHSIPQTLSWNCNHSYGAPCVHPAAVCSVQCVHHHVQHRVFSTVCSAPCVQYRVFILQFLSTVQYTDHKKWSCLTYFNFNLIWPPTVTGVWMQTTPMASAWRLWWLPVRLVDNTTLNCFYREASLWSIWSSHITN